MAISEIIKRECAVCHKLAVEKSRLTLGKTVMITLTCGHLQSYTRDILDESAYNSLIFSDGKSPRPYQIDAMKFAAENNFNIIIADEQGLGKTIEFLCLLKLYRKKLLPAVLVVPTTVKMQWMWEIRRICGTGPEYLTQVIQSGKEKAMPGFQIYIVTYDMLKKDDLFEWVPELRTIMIDECQRIKNHLSERAKACQRIASKVEYHIPMSGTPIKNNAGEYFTVLNMVAPQKFPSYQRFIEYDCDSYEAGWATKVGGLKDPQGFKEKTSNIIIRRTKAEVLKDLPAKDRKFHHVELDPKLNKAYADALKELDDYLYSDEGDTFTRGAAIIAIMGKMRHITGISKVPTAVEFATEFLLSCDRKLTIFVHHQDVGKLVQANLDSWLLDGGFQPSLMMSSALNADQRQALTMKFKDDPNARVMIASTLAAGEGLNLQFCSDAIMLERQWNPANEEQAEDRFHRFGQLNSVSITYMLASGTIDEYFTELVETKRSIIAATMDNKEIAWNEQSLMKELSELLVAKGRNRWSL